MWRSARAGGRAVAGVAAVVALVLVGTRPAGAAPELSLSPRSGPPGSTFLVTGTGFDPAEVVIRWGDETGTELGRAVGPDFALEVSVPPEAPPNSHRVMAVISDGGSVSTSSASFQVTGAGEPVEPVGTTTTTVAEAPVDPTPRTSPTTEPVSSAPSAAGGGLSRADSVGGGVEGGMASTTDERDPGTRTSATPAGSPVEGPGAGAGVTTTTAPTGTAPLPPAPVGTGDIGGRPVTGEDRTAAPGSSVGGGASGSALPSSPASQSAGAVQNPLLLFLGLGLVFAAGVILAIRNRKRPA